LIENKIQIISNNLKYNLNYLNKSFISNKNKDTKFKQLISSLINFENNILFQYQSKILFLINENWIQSFMMKLNYINLKNRNNEKHNNQNIIEEMFNEYIKNNDENEDIINPNNLIYSYLQDNNSGDIIKYYSKYSLVSEEIWEILIKFFNWNNNICINAYFIQNNNIIAQYDETNFEIIEVLHNYQIKHKLLFSFKDKNKAEEALNEIINLDIDEYFQKNNNKLEIKNDCCKLIYDNLYENIGIILDVNSAINNTILYSSFNYQNLFNSRLKLGLSFIYLYLKKR
jgi:hypothetical protein